MSVTELKQNQIEELKCIIFFATDEELKEQHPSISQETIDEIREAEIPQEIPTYIIEELFEGIDFVEDDFFSN